MSVWENLRKHLICLGVKKRLIPEEYLVNHLTMVFNNLGYPKHATESVAKACESLKKSSPLLENFFEAAIFLPWEGKTISAATTNSNEAL